MKNTEGSKILPRQGVMVTVSSRLCGMADSAQGEGTKGDEGNHHPSSIPAFSFRGKSHFAYLRRYTANIQRFKLHFTFPS